MTDRWEYPSLFAGLCRHAGVGEACKPCREEYEEEARPDLIDTLDHRYEWRVETNDAEDDFGSDEQAAHDWLVRCAANPDWGTPKILRRSIFTQVMRWEEINND